MKPNMVEAVITDTMKILRGKRIEGTFLKNSKNSMVTSMTEVPSWIVFLLFLLNIPAGIQPLNTDILDEWLV